MSVAARPTHPFLLPGYLVFAGSLAAGSAALLVDARLGLVAAAVIFGWTQIGGL